MIELAWLADAAKELIRVGLKAYQVSDSRRELRTCVRAQIKRELVFNREVLNELLRTNGTDEPTWQGDERERLIRALRTAGFDALDAHLIPLDVFFDDKLIEEQHSKVFCPDREKPPAHYSRVQDLNSQVDLLERTYRRLHFAKLYEESGSRKPNFEYLRYLVVSSILSLDGPGAP